MEFLIGYVTGCVIQLLVSSILVSTKKKGDEE